MIKEIKSFSQDETEQIAEKIGKQLKGRETIALISDLGGGKTTFVHGLVKGSGSADKIASPTFTISRVYEGDKFDIHHFDFYRLDDPGILKHSLSEAITDANSVTVIEWPAIVEGVLPEDRLTIKFKVNDVNERIITLNYPNSLSYLLK